MTEVLVASGWFGFGLAIGLLAGLFLRIKAAGLPKSISEPLSQPASATVWVTEDKPERGVTWTDHREALFEKFEITGENDPSLVEKPF